MNNFYRDHFSNFKGYHLPKAQLVIADMPYNIGVNAYGSNPQWYVDGDNKNGESELANSKFFQTDEDFNSYEFMHFVHKMLRKEPKERGKAPCMIVFCSFEQQFALIELAKKHGLPNYINLVFHKNYSAQVLKANMRVVGNSEYALLFYRNKLPKFNNGGKMVFNNMEWVSDDTRSPLYRKVHPTQKPVALMQRLIEIFTDPGDVVIDPTAGSGSTIIAAEELGRKAYGFEIDRNIYPAAKAWIEMRRRYRDEVSAAGFSPSLIAEQAMNGQSSLFAATTMETA